LKSENSSVLSLRDLENWPSTGTSLAVLGQPINHSISPAMHNAALRAMATLDPRFRSWHYDRFEVPPAGLAAALQLFHARGFRGLNLTVPHKVLAVASVETMDDFARSAGAVNTLLRTERGWRGYNTDGYGLTAGLRESLGCALHGSAVLLLGAGGAGRSAAAECLRQGCASLWISNRTSARLQELIDELKPLQGTTPVRPLPPGFSFAELPAGAIVINATSAGLSESDELPLDLSACPRPAVVYDMIYNPARTRLLREARRLGIPAANGLSMLVHQGARSLALWSEVEVPVDVMRAAATAALPS
jgi:shikimate dehydrogenase